MAHLTNFSFELFYEIFTKMPLYFFYTMVQKSQEMTKNSNEGGPAFLVIMTIHQKFVHKRLTSVTSPLALQSCLKFIRRGRVSCLELLRNYNFSHATCCHKSQCFLVWKDYSKIGRRRTYILRDQATRSYLQAAFLSRTVQNAVGQRFTIHWCS